METTNNKVTSYGRRLKYLLEKEKHKACLVYNKLKSEQPRRRENGYVVVKV
jgi:hypothetical protein